MVPFWAILKNINIQVKMLWLLLANFIFQHLTALFTTQ